MWTYLSGFTCFCSCCFDPIIQACVFLQFSPVFLCTLFWLIIIWYCIFARVFLFDGRWTECEFLPFPLVHCLSSLHGQPVELNNINILSTTPVLPMCFPSALLTVQRVFAGCTILVDTPMLRTNWCYTLPDAMSEPWINDFYCFFRWCLFRFQP